MKWSTEPHPRQRGGVLISLVIVSEVLRGYFGPDAIAPLEAHRQDARITSSKLLPRMLELKQKSLSYRATPL
ncbi:unnamed protein product [Gemmata massiliana]|uniref:Uncharacterized protein n=1 Tax=Gemmata massiliana TaxID=1210884 RepID=A0A6P2D0I9_9BACT|nr:unnamed protein product [Gemmata massiliana]